MPAPTRSTVVQGLQRRDAVEGGIDAAVAAANAADVVLLAIGEARPCPARRSRAPRSSFPAAAEAGGSRRATGKPIVVLLSTGRALALEGAVRTADAILVTWFLGTETGNAIADVLFGDYNPRAGCR